MDIDSSNDDLELADLDIPDQLITIAKLGGAKDLAKALVQIPQININTPNNDGDTALLLAAEDNDLSLVQIILGMPGVNVNAKNIFGQTALILVVKSISKKKAAMVQILLAAGADAEIRDWADYTALDYAEAL